MAVWHHAFVFDGMSFLDDVARAAGAAPDRWAPALARAAHQTVERANPTTRRVLESLRYEANWLTEGPDRMLGRLLAVVLAGHLEPIPSLGGGDAHSWLVLERLAMLSTEAASQLRRLVRGEPLSQLPAALGRPDLTALFQDARDLGGCLVASEVALLSLSLGRLEHLFLRSTVAEAAAFGDWVHARTPESLARAKRQAFADAGRMLKAANGRSLYMVFEQ